MALHQGELLPGRYEPWVLTERQTLAELYLGALQQLAAARGEAGDLAAAWRRVRCRPAPGRSLCYPEEGGA